MHRALAFPLHRNWGLALHAAKDVACIFRLGRRALLRALLETRRILAAHEHRHYLNTLFVDDYCVWVQTLSLDRIATVANELRHANLTQADMRWPLKDLEELAAEHAGDATSELGDDDKERPSML